MDIPEVFVGIDPSINHTGYGIIRTVDGVPKLLASGVIRPKPEYGDMRLFFLTVGMLQHVFPTKGQLKDLMVVGIERPTYEDSPRGRELRRKHFDKLCFASAVPVVVASFYMCPWVFITSSQWKRKFNTKLDIQKKVEEYFPGKKGHWKGNTGDEWEAVGIALWMWKQWGTFKVHEIHKLTAKEVEGGYKY